MSKVVILNHAKRVIKVSRCNRIEGKLFSEVGVMYAVEKKRDSRLIKKDSINE